jgi:CO/xanthine dehydrogenase FAD-binding subunit
MYEPVWKSPSTLAEALDALAEAGAAGRAMAGGTDLAVQIANGQRRPDVLVDLGRLRELVGVRQEGDGHERLVVGAATTHREVVGDGLVGEAVPLLADACRTVGAPQVRSRGTIGGNIANGSPAADAAVALLALDAVAVVEKAEGGGAAREVHLAEIFREPGVTSLTEGELLTRVTVERPGPAARSAYLKAGPRNALAIAIVSVAADFDPDSGRLRMALGSVAPTPVRASEAESVFAGRWDGCAPSEELLRDVAEAAGRGASPISDVRASADYRLMLVEALTRRALEEICF